MKNWIFGSLATLAVAGPLQAQDAPVASIYFEAGSSELLSTAKMTLDAVLAQNARQPEVVYLLEGHTDTAGSAADNLVRSANMANAVAAYLQSKGVPSNRIMRAAYGESLLAKETGDDITEPLNRRVEISVAMR